MMKKIILSTLLCASIYSIPEYLNVERDRIELLKKKDFLLCIDFSILRQKAKAVVLNWIDLFSEDFPNTHIVTSDRSNIDRLGHISCDIILLGNPNFQQMKKIAKHIVIFSNKIVPMHPLKLQGLAKIQYEKTGCLINHNLYPILINSEMYNEEQSLTEIAISSISEFRRKTIAANNKIEYFSNIGGTCVNLGSIEEFDNIDKEKLKKINETHNYSHISNCSKKFIDYLNYIEELSCTFLFLKTQQKNDTKAIDNMEYHDTTYDYFANEIREIMNNIGYFIDIDECSVEAIKNADIKPNNEEQISGQTETMLLAESIENTRTKYKNEFLEYTLNAFKELMTLSQYQDTER